MTMLEHINGPEGLKQLSQDQLGMLASEIREFLVESVTTTSGHLGVVELTIALHLVFDSPKDKLVFDTGHRPAATR
jgi:1-deoxy-D-xylulose-5-phosphate synthase